MGANVHLLGAFLRRDHSITLIRRCFWPILNRGIGGGAPCDGKASCNVIL
jgi:hypothetical protein